MSIVGIILHPRQRWLLGIVVFYVSIDVVFYVVVLIFGLRALGSEISPYRSVMQNAILLSTLYCYLRGDLSRLVLTWKSL